MLLQGPYCLQVIFPLQVAFRGNGAGGAGLVLYVRRHLQAGFINLPGLLFRKALPSYAYLLLL